MKKMECLMEAAKEFDEVYWTLQEASKRKAEASRKLGRAMKDVGMQTMHFRELTIQASRLDDPSPSVTVAMVAETLEEL